jgi:predicted component of type VI protein secretion system
VGRLIVKFTHQKNQLFDLKAGDAVIGRGETAALMLPNVSVSREHCRIVVGAQNTSIEDLDSQNGTIVNGKPIQQHVLASGDEIQVGKFQLIYLGEGRENRFYKGRYVHYLPKYEPRSVMPDAAATFALTADALMAMQVTNRVVEHARLVLATDQRRFWYPEEKGLSFGSAGLVPVDGWFTWGVVATVKWDGKRHRLERQSWLAHVSVGDRRLDHHRLKDGDRVRIGTTRFRYECPE